MRFHTGEPELLLKGYLKVTVQNIKLTILNIEYVLIFASKLWESIPMSLKLVPPNSFRAHYKLDFLVLSDQ